jgi:hypothetical protein
MVEGEDEFEDDGDDGVNSDGNDKRMSLGEDNADNGGKEQLLELIESSGGMDRIFPPLDGTAFYSTICHINHSCDPNVIVRYKSTAEGVYAFLTALRDIAEGEELVQSYIDNTLG